MLDVGTSLQPQSSSKAGRDCYPSVQRQGALRSPTWPRSQRGWKQELLETSALQMHVFTHILQRTGNPLPISERGEGSVGKAGRKAGHFSKEVASVSPPCPKGHP